MKRPSIIFIMLAIACGLTLTAQSMACDALFVQNSKGMAFDGKLLTLKGANPIIIYFCDRPEREAGHLTREAFLELVSEGENSFTENPPNGAVSIFGPGDEVTEAVVELAERPFERGDDLVFPIKVLLGELPKTGGAVALFIDPIGRPLSPTSRAGVHRRHQRRAIRHIR